MTDPLWYKDTIIYQTHVKAFFDSNNDGVGDIQGLIDKLDYVQDLGVTAIWLLPFYPSPLRDDGYDIKDYRRINETYGSMRDVRRFINECHKRDIKVITELVINHTSDQHPWFQRARLARPGSKHRDYYVWSDNDQKYGDTRIIFLDTEKSNWTWDPVAQAYYWHRFYSHQPDLNFDNPLVVAEVKSLLHYWLRMGIDGLRLDAIPYLIERDGTNCENLPETHAVLKDIRREIDLHFPGRMLLAEANQWPEDTRPYFGDGDECHMAFHFPLMPRMYMALAQEDRHPITDIMRQTPELPAGCQWAIFLRNHDELTLEMVTERERDYMWNFYAADRRMRINQGIRRRLAPLMDNDRRKIELMNSLLFSMPGTPVVYYGDELGMGDNVFLGDRDGVRTPMQWSPDRNGGFSKTNPQALYLPALMDSVYGYHSVNVEAQHGDPSSLLNWMRRLIAVRKAHKAFSRGTLSFIYPGNRKILAYLRDYEREAILCVCNLSRSAQPAELDLSPYKGRIPVELLGRASFPPIGDLPYLLTLPGHGFYWFILAEEAEVPAWHEDLPEPLPEFTTVVLTEGWRAVTAERTMRNLETGSLAPFLRKQRWFAAKSERLGRIRMVRHAELDDHTDTFLLSEFEVALDSGERQTYFLPLAVVWGEDHLAYSAPLLPFTIGKARRGSRVGALYDAAAGEKLALALLAGMRDERHIESHDGEIRLSKSPRLDQLHLPDDVSARRLGTEQSNSSLLIGRDVIMKLYRRIQPGIHPEIEIGRFLTDVADYRNTPPLLGAVERIDDRGRSTALGVAFGFVLNQGDGWTYTLDYLDRELEQQALTVVEDEPHEDTFGYYRALMRMLGQRTAEMHRAFAIETDDPAFAAEPLDPDVLERWRLSIRRQAETGLRALKSALGYLKEEERDQAAALVARPELIDERIDRLTSMPVQTSISRLHGDFHLGQVLVAQNDFYILDFEGEPSRELEERRSKTTPLKDVAGMLRSFDYAAISASQAALAKDGLGGEVVLNLAQFWKAQACRTFLDSYRHTIQGCRTFPGEIAEADALLELFLIEKALYELAYEAANRPAWIAIPLNGLRDLLEDRTPDYRFSHGQD